MWGLPLNTSNIHRWYAIGKGLARFSRFPGAAQPDALFVMPASAPIFTELPCHAAVVDAPHQCAVLHDLLDGWCAHKKAGTYTDCLAYREHNRPERASCDGGTGELWRLQERTELMPRLSEVEVGLALASASLVSLGRQREVRHAQLEAVALAVVFRPGVLLQLA